MEQSSLRFSDPILDKLDYEINKDFNSKESNDLNMTNEFKVKISKADDDSRAIVSLNIILGNREDSVEYPFYIDMVIVAGFSWDDSYDEETVNNLLSINAPALLLSYSRPIISNITSMSPYPKYNLPFYNFTK